MVSRLCRFGDLLGQVIEQISRRVLNGGEEVLAAKKMLSIFEPNTDLIVKEDWAGSGYKVFFSSAPRVAFWTVRWLEGIRG